MRDRWGNITGRMKLTIRMKLLAGFLIVGALLAFVSIFSLSQIQGMSKSAEEIDQSRMPSVSLLGMMNGDVSDIERLALGVIVETDTNEIAKMNETLQQLQVKIEGERKELITLLKGNAEALALYDTFSKNYDAYLAKMLCLSNAVWLTISAEPASCIRNPTHYGLLPTIPSPS